MDIKIIVSDITLNCRLRKNKTAGEIIKLLPLKSTVNTWGDEIYFGIPVEADIDQSAREVVELGDIGYWPPGNALCLFFGPTPLSISGEIRPASAVNVVGVMLDDPTVLKQVAPGELVIITRA